MNWLQLTLEGEVWAEYARGMRFPERFRHAYPMRGGGHVSRLLYILNKYRLDGLLLKHADANSLRESHAGFEDVAFFYPASSRSKTRYYGFRVKDGAAISYLKFATTLEEAAMIRKEVANTEVAEHVPGRTFNVPHCLRCEDLGKNGGCFAEFDLLPSSAVTIPCSDEMDRRIFEIQHQLSRAGIVHGDFAAQNIKLDGDGILWVIDWEESSRELPVLCDEISYWTAMEHYGKSVPIAEVWTRFRQRYIDSSDLKDAAYAAIVSMAKRKIAMGRELLEMWR